MEASELVSDDACAREVYAVATACADGAVRIFSSDSASHLPPAEQQERLAPQPEPFPPAAEDYAMSTTLPRASERSQFKGVQLGAISLFLDDEEGVTGASSANAVVACQWL